MLNIRIILLILISIGSAALSAADYKTTYHVTKSENQGCLNVLAKFASWSANELLLVFPETGMDAFRITSIKGHQLFDTKDLLLKKIFHQIGDPIYITYEFCSNNPAKDFMSSYIEDDFLFITSWMLFVMDFDHIYEPKQIAVYFDGFDLTQFYSSRKTFQTQFHYDISVADFLQQFFMLTTLNPQEQNIFEVGKIKKFPKYFKLEIQKIQNKADQFWKEETEEPLDNFFILNATSTAAVRTGIHPEGAIVMSFNKDIPYKQFLTMISHEYFHQWLGLEIKFPQPQGNFQWLLEGFTDYFGTRLLNEIGLLTDKEYIEAINKVLLKYYMHPLRGITQSDIFTYYYKNAEYSNLAMYQGHLAALAVQEPDLTNNIPFDNAVLSRAVRFLKQELKNSKSSTVNEELLEKAFLKSLTPAQWQTLKYSVRQTMETPLAPTLLQHKAILKEKEIQYPDFGFNLKELIVHNRIQDLDLKSPAYQAGIRENDLVLRSDINIFEKRSASLVVDRDGTPTTYQFPVYKMARSVIPQYELREDSARLR